MIKHVVYGLSSNEINEDTSVERIPNRKHTRHIDMDCMKNSIIDFQSVEVNSNKDIRYSGDNLNTHITLSNALLVT